jgi:Tfp pilus assembly protein PilV
MRRAAGTQGARTARRRDAGFSLMEAIVATLIATIAVIGLAYTFGLGRSFIDRFEVSRAALAAAQARVEALVAAPASSSDLATGAHNEDFVVNGLDLGEIHWVVGYWDDPADGLGAADPNPNDLKIVTVEVSYRQGSAADTLRLSKLFPAS